VVGEQIPDCTSAWSPAFRTPLRSANLGSEGYFLNPLPINNIPASSAPHPQPAQTERLIGAARRRRGWWMNKFQTVPLAGPSFPLPASAPAIWNRRDILSTLCPPITFRLRPLPIRNRPRLNGLSAPPQARMRAGAQQAAPLRQDGCRAVQMPGGLRNDGSSSGEGRRVRMKLKAGAETPKPL